MSNDSTQPGNPFTRRGFIAAAIIIGMILLAAVIVLVTSRTAPHDPVAKPTASPSAPVASGADRSVCGLSGFETKNSLTAAPETKWELVGTVAAPNNPKVGPGKVDSNGLRTCFAHTSAGALFATVNYVALSSDARTRPLITDLIEPGPGRDAVKNTAGQNGNVSSNSRLQVAGFKVNAYTPHEAVIDVAWAVTSSGGQLVSFPIVLQWVDGDWKIVLTDKGAFPFTSAPLSSLGGYIQWAGV